ncbi:uncharacterized protein LOC113326702 [Papaver somniferum]|uniref:uncharacterized protein LOC113326702 n=1 Tax=Papaver somniferum TaxID=3469 RepID=UPI000E703CA0|nr:uncharacterized protein LOC113326702 [Papaver somniferum]
MRKKLDALTIDDVVFDPYLRRDEDRVNEVGDRLFSDVATYLIPLFHPTGFVILDPRRKLRQIGIVHKIVPEASHFKPSITNSQFKDKDVKLTYEAVSLIDHSNARSEQVNQDVGLKLLIEIPMRMRITWNGIKNGLILMWKFWIRKRENSSRRETVRHQGHQGLIKVILEGDGGTYTTNYP